MKDYKAILIEVYTKYNPSQLSKIETLLEKYRGQEELLVERVILKYKPMTAEGKKDFIADTDNLAILKEAVSSIDNVDEQEGKENTQWLKTMGWIAIVLFIVSAILVFNNRSSIASRPTKAEAVEFITGKLQKDFYNAIFIDKLETTPNDTLVTVNDTSYYIIGFAARFKIIKLFPSDEGIIDPRTSDAHIDDGLLIDKPYTIRKGMAIFTIENGGWSCTELKYDWWGLQNQYERENGAITVHGSVIVVPGAPPLSSEEDYAIKSKLEKLKK